MLQGVWSQGGKDCDKDTYLVEVRWLRVQNVERRAKFELAGMLCMQHVS